MPRASENRYGCLRSCPALAQPDRSVRGLDRKVDGVDEAAANSIEVDLIAQPKAEYVERARRVVPRAVEASVNDALDPRPERLEQRDARECGAGDSDLGSRGEWSKECLQHDDAAKERTTDQCGRSAVDQRPVDEDIDVVKAVAEHSDSDRDRHSHMRDIDESAPWAGEAARSHYITEGDKRCGVDEELKLLPLHTGRAPPTRYRGRGDRKQERDHHGDDTDGQQLGKLADDS